MKKSHLNFFHIVNKKKSNIHFFSTKTNKVPTYCLFGNMSLFGSLEYFGASFKTCMIFSDHVTTPLHTLKSKVFPKLHSRFLMQMFRGRWEVGSLCFYSKNLSEVPETSLKIAVGQNLTTLGVVGTFGITSLPQRLISQSLYKEIILLQKLLDIGGKVLNPQKISLQPQKKGHFLVIDCV